MFYNIQKSLFINIFIVFTISLGQVYAQQLGNNKATMKLYIPPEIDYPAGKTIKLNKLDLNNASLQQIMSLPQINEDIALKIIRKRPIKSLEDIYHLPFLDVNRVKIIINGFGNLVTQSSETSNYEYLKK